jgi:hypothetical protein
MREIAVLFVIVLAAAAIVAWLLVKLLSLD